jgi:hypothetical protein
MIKRFWLLILIQSTLSMESQNWDSIRGGKPNGQIEGVIFDSVHNELIVSSKFLTQIGSLPVRGIARWNGSRWDSLAGGINTHSIPNGPGGNVLCGIPYNGKLLVGGQFKSIGGINATSLALWDGIKWDSLPKRAFSFNSNAPQINGLFKSGNLIYISGNFTTIAGQPATGLATWDGSTFSPITFTFNSFIGVGRPIIYKNDLYITGGYFYNPPFYIDNSDVMRYDGTDWNSMIPGGIKGFAGGVSDMVVFNNELYIAGHFLISDGNLANNIMKYDGTIWKDIGFGASSNFQQIRKLIVHKNKLWAYGCFDIVANIPAFSVSVFDGINWCTLQDTVDNCIGSATIYNDTMYVGGGFWTAGGDSNITYLAKLRDPNLYKSCVNIGVNELREGNADISFFPNPVSNKLYISSEQYFEKGTEIEIINTLAQTVLKLNYSNEIDVSQLSSGCYILKIITSVKAQFNSKFIKE